MNIWFRLSPDQAHDFQVPWDVAAQSDNQFFSTATLSNLYFDGPWLLLAFQENGRLPGVVSFQPCSVEFCYINEFDTYNPLSSLEGSRLSLSRRELHGLTELLDEVSQQLPAAKTRPFQTFEKLDPMQWSHFHLEATPSLQQCRQVYLQVQDPLAPEREESVATLLVLTAPTADQLQFGHRRIQTIKLSVQFCQFSLSQLADPDFNPLASGCSHIDLDRIGLRELASILDQFANAYGAPTPQMSYAYAAPTVMPLSVQAQL